MIHRRPRLAIAVAALGLLSACGGLLDPAAAVVNGNKITIDEVQDVVDQFTTSEAYLERAQQGEGDIVQREFERNYLSQLIRREVLIPAAADAGVVIDEADVEERIEQIKADFPNEAAFKETLREQGLNPVLLRQLVEDRLYEDRLRAEVTKGVAPSEEDLVDFYDQNRDDYRETRAQHILVEGKELATKLVAQLDLALAERVEAVFTKLAAEHSIDETTASQGGDLGYAAPGRYVEAFDAAIRRLEVNEISDPVRTEFGWHVIRVIDRRVKAFEDVRAEIEQQLAQPLIDKAWLEWLEDAYAEAGVEVNPRYGTFDVATQQVIDPEAENVPGAEAPQEETGFGGGAGPIPTPGP